MKFSCYIKHWPNLTIIRIVTLEATYGLQLEMKKWRATWTKEWVMLGWADIRRRKSDKNWQKSWKFDNEGQMEMDDLVNRWSCTDEINKKLGRKVTVGISSVPNLAAVEMAVAVSHVNRALRLLSLLISCSSGHRKEERKGFNLSAPDHLTWSPKIIKGVCWKMMCDSLHAK